MIWLKLPEMDYFEVSAQNQKKYRFLILWDFADIIA